MNNAAGNEMGDDGDRNVSSQQLVYMCFAVLKLFELFVTFSGR